MSKNVAATDTKPKKMTKAEFLIVLDEANATLAKQIEEIKASQARTQALAKKTRQGIAETRAILERL